MRSRPTTVTVAAVLSALLALSNLPGPWMALFPGAEDAPDFVIYSGIVLAIAGLLLAFGLWTVVRWSYWPSIAVCVVNILFGLMGLFEAPGTALKIAIAVTMVVAAIIIALLLRPASKQAFAGPLRATG